MTDTPTPRDQLQQAIADEQAAIANEQSVLAQLPPDPVSSPVPLSYPLGRTDRTAFPKPPLPTIGPAGSTFVDPLANLTVRRITDRNTEAGVSYRTPSDLQLRAWNADGTMFYLVNTWGSVRLFDFNKTAGTATLRVDSSGAPVNFPFQGEPDWHPTEPTVLVGSLDTGTVVQIIAFDVNARTQTVILDLQTLTTVNLEQPVRTYSRSCEISKSGTRVCAIFAGAGQDLDHLAVALDLTTTPPTPHVLDTLAGTLDGVALPVIPGLQWNWHLHAAWLDHSGRYLSLATTAADLAITTKHLPPIAYWDLQTNTITPAPAAAILGGHISCGYGTQVNQASGGSVLNTPPDYAAAQWQFAALATPAMQTALIDPLLDPGELYCDGHTSWHNAQPTLAAPFVAGLYRYTFAGGPNPPDPTWFPGDGEILAVQPTAPATVWRFVQHRTDPRWSTVINGVLTADPTQSNYFWASPRPQGSLDGEWVLFTSNMEQSLGIDPHAEPGGSAAQDVFLVKLVA